MGIIDNLFKQFTEQGTIVHKSTLSEAVYHIRIQGDHIKSAIFKPGYFLRLGVGIGSPEASLRDKVRSYSVWDIDKVAGTIDLAIALHSNGIGAAWIKNCNVGDSVSFVWKKGNFVLDDRADSYVMIGDLSALSHLYAINRHLHPDKQVESMVYSGKRSELFADIDRSTPFDFYEMGPNPEQGIIHQVREIIPKLTGRPMVYIGGDSRVCVALTQFFRRELHWNTTQIKTKPFWNPSKKGLD